MTRRTTFDRGEGRRLFGHDPETYDRVRPGHPDAVYEILRDRCGLGIGSKVLEIGPGTGQASRRLLDYGAGPLVGVEPDPRLARFLRESIGDRIEVLESTLEDAGLGTDFDLAAAASSFHWVEEALGLAKLRDALRPGGWIALWWSSFGDEKQPHPFLQATDTLYEDLPCGPSGPSGLGLSFARDSENRLRALADAGFEQGTHDDVHWSNEWDSEGIRGLYSTYSPIASLEPVRRADLLAAVERIAATQFGGRVVLPLATSLYTGRKPS